MAELKRTTCPLCRRGDVPLTAGGKLREHKPERFSSKVCDATGYEPDHPRIAELIEERRASADARSVEESEVAAAWSELEIAGISRDSFKSLADAVRFVLGQRAEFQTRITHARDLLAAAPGVH